MQNAVGPEGLNGLFEGEVAMEAEPFAGVTMPLNVEAVAQKSLPSRRWRGAFSRDTNNRQ
jgi:hypothetical protein